MNTPQTEMQAMLKLVQSLMSNLSVAQCVCNALADTHPNREALFEAFSRRMDDLANTLTPDQLIHLRKAAQVWNASLSGPPAR